MMLDATPDELSSVASMVMGGRCERTSGRGELMSLMSERVGMEGGHTDWLVYVVAQI